MKNLLDYQILETLSETDHCAVYRGMNTKSSESVMIQFLKCQDSSDIDRIIFQQEYDIIRKLKTSGLVRVYDCQSVSGGFALVLEEFTGESLKTIIT